MSATRYFYFLAQDIIVPPRESPREATAPSWFPGPVACGDGCDGDHPVRRRYEWAGVDYEAGLLDEVEAARLAAAGSTRMMVRQAIALYPDEEVRAFLKGLALVTWLAGARYCGACGSPLADASGENAGGRVCGSCGRVHFPRISPAVIVLVRKGDTALLARNTRFPSGRFGLIAGFVESGETLEEAVRREVREESGIEIDDIAYRTSQPWPFPDSLMVAFTARWKSGEAVPDGVEIAELRWCEPWSLPAIPPPGSVARLLIDEFARSVPEPGETGD